MTDTVYHQTTAALADRRRELAPDTHRAFDEFSHAVFGAGALDRRTKQLIAVAVAHVTQCPYCIDAHTRLAQRKGASPEQIMEAIWVAAEMRAGGAFAHSTLALHALDNERSDANDATFDSPEQVAVDSVGHADHEAGKSPWWMSADWG
jgi:AhpD family alkylhydroperoxidase